MRLWVIILIIAVAITTLQQIPLVQHMRSIIRTVRQTASSTRAIPRIQPSSSSTRPFSQTTNMVEAVSSNPVPVFSDAALADAKKAEQLPKLSTEDFRVYNRLAAMMDAYHNRFRHTWNMLYKGASENQRPAGVSIRGFLNAGLQLCQHLTVHHTIEEQHIFPDLAERMPVFKDDGHLIEQHHQIHEGLELLEKYLQDCQFGEKELRMNELKDIMDTFGRVLWEHLDQEVEMLGAENMRKYWTKREIMDMQF